MSIPRQVKELLNLPFIQNASSTPTISNDLGKGGKQYYKFVQESVASGFLDPELISVSNEA
jgi:hypothetical protein